MTTRPQRPDSEAARVRQEVLAAITAKPRSIRDIQSHVSATRIGIVEAILQLKEEKLIEAADAASIPKIWQPTTTKE